MRDVTAIILAAGFSRRMGDQNKLLLPINGIPMIRHVVEVYGAISTRPVMVVTGHEAEDVAAAIAQSNAIPVFNPAYAQGQPTSVACGLRAADDGCDLLVGLGDQPLLTPKDLRDLLDAHAAANVERISIPVRGEERGNPIVIPSALRARLLADPHSPGCKKFTRANPDHVQFHTLTATGFFTDVDAPEAYSSLINSTMEAAQ